MRAGIIIAASAMASSVHAHDWYSDKSDPITQKACCGQNDCRPIPATDVRELPNGFFLYMPRNWTIPPDRVQRSPDFEYHICSTITYVGPDQRHGLGWPPGNTATYELRMICFFAPPGTI